jgi:gas vesicle protein GvpA/GvpJ/GvpM family
MTSTVQGDAENTPIPTPGHEARAIALVDLLDRLLGTGVVVAGDVLISLAGVDLVELRLRALLRTVDGEDQR